MLCRRNTRPDCRKLFSCGVGALLFFHPLFLTDRYYNITESKFFFFAAAVLLLVLFSAGAALFRPAENPSARRGRFDKGAHLAWGAFALSGAVTLLLSAYRPEALTGSEGRWLGYLFCLAAVLLFLVCSRFFVLSEQILLAYQVSLILVALLAIVQRFGADPFGLMATVPANKKAVFLSTIGNADVFASFLCVSVPVAMFQVAQGSRNAVYTAAAALGFFALFAAGSDSGCIGLAAAFWLLTLLSFRQQEALRRVCFLGVVFFGAAVVYRVFLSCGLLLYHGDGLAVWLTSFRASLPGLAVFCALWLLLKTHPLLPATLRRLRAAFVTVSALAAAALGGAMLWFSANDARVLPEALAPYLRMDDAWGSERGLIWRSVLTLFGRCSPLQKLFGCGQDCLYLALSDYAFEEMTALQALTDNAHNELLQYLATTGLVGLAAYLAVVGVSLRRMAQKRKTEPLFGAVLLAAVGYLAQSVVNISQAITTPLFFALLCIGCAGPRQPDETA